MLTLNEIALQVTTTKFKSTFTRTTLKTLGRMADLNKDKHARKNNLALYVTNIGIVAK